jgi:uncharacterized damage-inducible protein DinB
VLSTERELLEQFLDLQRATLLRKCEDLAPEQLGRAPLASKLSLHGLVRHLSRVERWWFRMVIAGMELPPLHISRDEPDLDFDGVDPMRWQADLASYKGEVAAARAAVADVPLDVEAQGVTLRWVYLHMIAEYARHNGHADLIREQIDGRTGL